MCITCDYTLTLTETALVVTASLLILGILVYQQYLRIADALDINVNLFAKDKNAGQNRKKGGKSDDIKQVKAVANLKAMDDVQRKNFGKCIEQYKDGGPDLSWDELLDLADIFFGPKWLLI